MTWPLALMLMGVAIVTFYALFGFFCFSWMVIAKILGREDRLCGLITDGKPVDAKVFQANEKLRKEREAQEMGVRAPTARY